ncbi:MAG TPA: ATP-binding protein [Pirellulales bacterium]|nr:ATP-binding protein [Pirellulales bacterium]
MIHSRATLLGTAAALAVAAGAASLADFNTWASSWWVRFGCFTLAMLLSAPPWMSFLTGSRRRSSDARRQLERLCQADPSDASALTSIDEPASIGVEWTRTLALVRETFVDRSNKLLEAEHARTALEIRGRRSAEQAERTMNILSGLPEAVIAIDAFDAVLLANPSAQRLFGFEGAPTGPTASQCVPSARWLATLNELRRHQTPAARTEELELEADGASRWYRVTTTPVPIGGAAGEDDGQRGAVAVFRDISAQKASQRHNAEFVSAASHEMKTPLAGIKAYVELLADGDAEDEATREEFLGVINGQADRLQRLIDNLLNIARIEAGLVRVSKQSRPLNEILEQAYRVVLPRADAKRIKLVRDLSPLYLGVHADRDMLLQAAINLLSNAVKYTPSDGTVTLRSRLFDVEAQFEVEDTGVGLSADDCQRVFDKFYRVEKNKQMAPGTGLGLPLAKYIVEDVHNGALTVESELGRGSTFRVTLPGSTPLS